MPSVLPPSGDQLLVSEKFVSLQGEGLSTGAPAAFLRLGNCNLTCVYCDTAYTWDASRFDLEKELKPEPVSEVTRWVVAHAPGRLIITGGEPLLQQRLLVRLLTGVDQMGAQEERLVVEVETNGTVKPVEELVSRIDQWNVSPKLSCSGEPFSRRMKNSALAAFVSNERANFKFVVDAARQVDEVHAFAEQWQIAANRISLMPEARTVETLRKRAPEVAQAASAKRYRYSGRLHLELFDGRRGT